MIDHVASWCMAFFSCIFLFVLHYIQPADKPYVTFRIHDFTHSPSPYYVLFFFLTACPLTPPFCLLSPPHSFHDTWKLYLALVFFFLAPLSLATPSCLSPLRLCVLLCCAGCCHRESWKLLQPFTQLQRVQHRPGHQRGDHHTAVRRVLWPQGWRCAHPLSVGGHQLRRGPAHPNVHSHWPGGEDGGTCVHWPQW